MVSLFLPIFFVCKKYGIAFFQGLLLLSLVVYAQEIDLTNNDQSKTQDSLAHRQSTIAPKNLKPPQQGYSIINDLRNAFEGYSTLSRDYTQFVIEKQKIQGTHKPTYHDYLLSLQPFQNNHQNTQMYINSFDKGLQKPQKPNTFETIQAETQKNTQENNADSNISNSKTHIQRSNNTQKESDFDIAILAPKCVNKKFNLKKDEDLNPKAILNALAKDCGFSIQYNQNPLLKRNPQEVFGNLSVINIDQKGLDFILNLLLHDIFYEVTPNRLILKDHDMKMFEINYVSSTRMAQSNTDILFSQQQYNQNYSGFSNGFYNGYNSGYLNLNNPSMSFTQNQGTSGYLDSLSLKNQLRNQMNYSNNQFGKSGTKIYSVDEINFWADIESKLNILLDSKVGDRFMIDKGAGLVSVWTTKNKMQEVAFFLHNLESKMNLQVAIDVEILSLTHYNSNNVGIDWQEIFSILNPRQSQLNIAVGGSTTLTLGNNSSDLRSIFNLLRTYGDLRSLSNPKIMALNNQPAIISVGSVLWYSQNLVYQSNNTNNTIQNTSTQYPSVFAGILLDITPSISQDEIILRINPSITKTKDPELENMAQALTSPPNLSTNQLSSIVKLKDGQRVIIGGLLNNVSQTTTQAIPKLGEVKGLRRIFGKESKIQRNEELIIVITPHIVR